MRNGGHVMGNIERLARSSFRTRNVEDTSAEIEMFDPGNTQRAGSRA